MGRVRNVDSMMHFRGHKNLDITGLSSAKWKRNVREASSDHIKCSAHQAETKNYLLCQGDQISLVGNGGIEERILGQSISIIERLLCQQRETRSLDKSS